MFQKQNKENIKKKMIEEKTDEFLRAQILEEYLIERIEEGEKERRNNLLDIQKLLTELKNQLEFLKKI